MGALNTTNTERGIGSSVRREPHPLIYPALGLLLGIFGADWLEATAWPLLLGAGLAGLATLYQGLRQGRFKPWLLALLGMLAGAGLLAHAQAWTPGGGHVVHLADGKRHQVIADVVAAAEPSSRGHYALVRALDVDGQAVHGLIRLSLPGDAPPPRMGRRISASLKLKPFTSFANPGAFDYAAFMAQKGIMVRAYAGKTSKLSDLGMGKTGWPIRLVEGARERLSRIIATLEPGPARGLLRALILGQRGEIPRSLREAFGGLGAAHLLAISGLHLGLVWAMGYGLLRLLLALWPRAALRWPVQQAAALGAMLPALAYAALAGWSTPTLRAVIMAAALTLGLCLGRTYRAEGGLALACLIIGTIWPQSVLTVSFQLSFVAVSAILLVVVPMFSRWPVTGFRGKALKTVAGWVGVSAVVGLAIWPLAVRQFHQLPVWSIAANAVLVPLVGLITLPLGLAGAFLGLVWPWAGGVVLGLAMTPAAWAVGVVDHMAAWPGALTYVAGPGPWAVLLLYAGAVAALLLRGKKRWVIGLASIGLGLALALWPGNKGQADGLLTVWVLDVGQGSSAVAQLPDGRVMIIDGGGWPDSDFDLGRNVVAPFLWHLGLAPPSVVACSHRHTDHAGGLAFLVRQFEPDEVWVNSRTPSPAAFANLLEAAAKAGSRLLEPGELLGQRELGGVRVRVLWPPPKLVASGAPENDLSLFIGLGFGSTWVWLPGDVGPKVERRIAAKLRVQGEQVLVAPHHGGKGSLTPALLKRIRPETVVISAGCGNRYGSPAAGTLERARATHARVLTTARFGAVKLTSNGKTWRIETHLKRPRTCPESAKP